MDRILEFTGNHTLLVVALLISFFVLVFSELRRKASGMIAIPANAAVSLMNNDAVVVDLRSQEAYARGHITNAKNIPLEDLDTKKESLDKGRPLVAVCDTGMSSNKAVAQLRLAGFDSAYGLKGGMNAWTQAGLPIVTGKKTRPKGRKTS